MIFPALFLLAAAAPESVEDSLKHFTQVFAKVEANAADPASADQLIYGGAIPGMLQRLDPHSVFFDPTQYEQLQQMEKSERKGFGSVVSILPGRVIILQTLPGTPSAKAGLSPGDEILALNNYRLDRLDPDQLIQLLTAARQQEARLDVRRPGNARLLQFTLKPELMDAPSVDRVFLLGENIGYVRIANFDPQTGKQVRNAIEKLGGRSLSGLVLDLRGNPGGVVESALETASLFLKPGQRILTVRGRAAKAQDIDVPKTFEPYTFKLSVLVNDRTASAAEIVAGALQDHRRAAIIGERSFGKGLVQSIFPLSSNTAMALTTAFYYTPSGRSIQKPLPSGELRTAASRLPVQGAGGIQPDATVGPEPQTQLRIALDASGVVTAFATDYIARHKIEPTFEVTPALLDDFQVYASERSIRPAIGEWLRDRDWIASRVKQEIFNQALGVEKGDEVEAARDPQVSEAVRRLRTI